MSISKLLNKLKSSRPSVQPSKEPINLSSPHTMAKPVIAVAFYSTWGHVATLAAKIIAGVEATGAICKPYQFQETLSEDVLAKMGAGSSLRPTYPILTLDALKEADGILIGAPTRYGRMPHQVSAFFDTTGQLWYANALHGKFVGMFTSCMNQHGGHEVTALTTMPFFAHHGMVYVPFGYLLPEVMQTEIMGGASPWGASSIAGAGNLMPTEGDLKVAEKQGEHFAQFVGTYVRGKSLKA